MDERNERHPISSNIREMASRLQSIREILTSDRDSGLSADEQRAALDTVDSEIADRLNMERDGSTYDASVQAMVDEGVVDRYSHLLDRNGNTSPSSIAHSRRRVHRPLDRIQRQTDRMQRLASRSNPPVDSSVDFSSLFAPSRTRRASDEQDSDMDPPQSRDGKPVRKRRKLDDGTAEQARPQYGIEGTLIPGSLNMIMLDVDDSSDAHSQAYQVGKWRLCLPINEDVYRVKRNRCDILMKHSGGHPFALSKLIVTLPKRDYESPPLQGMVFVSMNRETLLSQSSHYNTYFPALHNHHRRRYDSYRPSVDYMRSTRSPRPSYRPRSSSSVPPHDNLWYDSGSSVPEMVEIPSLPGINTTLEAVASPEESPSGARSPRPWDLDHDYTRRLRGDRYPSTTSRARDRAYVTASELANRHSPTTSEDEEDEDQDHDQAEQDDPEEPAVYRATMPSQRELEIDMEEARQRERLQQIRNYRVHTQGYSHFSPEPHRGEEEDDDDDNENDNDNDHMVEQTAALESHLARRGYDIDTLRRRYRGIATGANAQSPRPIFYSSTKRLPGCTGMLQGQGPHSSSDRDPVVPHAVFSVGRDGRGAVAVNFQPEVSGVYILVKLWALCPNSNVAVQNIVPYGYGTVRQVPDLEFR